MKDEVYNLLAEMILYYEKSIFKDQSLALYKASTPENIMNYIENIKDKIQNHFDKYSDEIRVLLKDELKPDNLLIIIYNIKAIDSMIDALNLPHIAIEKVNWLNTLHCDQIKVYATYGNEYDYHHSANSCLSTFLDNIVYFVYGNCEINCLYISKELETVKEIVDFGFKIACVPYGIEETEQIIDSTNEKVKYGSTKRNVKLDERLIKSYSHAVNNGATLVFGAEMTGSKDIDVKLFEIFKEKPDSIIWTPPYHISENDEYVSKSILFNPQTRRPETIYKSLAYNDKKSPLGNYKIEDIVSKNVFTVLHVKNFGRILFIICSDYFHSNMEQIISQMRIDYVIISSYTSSYNKFNDDSASFIKSDRRVLVQCNNCANIANIIDKVKKEISESIESENSEEKFNEEFENQYMHPINVVMKDLAKVKDKINNTRMCDCRNQDDCSKKELCYFMLSFSIINGKLSLQKIDFVEEE